MTKKAYTGWRAMVADKFSAKYPTADERTAMVSDKSLAACGGIAILYVLIRLIWCGIHGSLAVPELILILIFGIVIASMERQHEIHTLPKMAGVTLDPKPEAKGKRTLLYAADSLLLAVIYVIFDRIGVFNFAKDSLTDLVIQAVTILTVGFLLNLWLGEGKVKRYNRAMEQLAAEENDLSD